MKKKKTDEKPQTVKSLGINKRAIDTTIDNRHSLNHSHRHSHRNMQSHRQRSKTKSYNHSNGRQIHKLSHGYCYKHSHSTVICKSIGKLARQSQKAVKFKNMYQAQPIGAATVIAVSTDKDIAIGTAIGIGKRQSHISSQRKGKFKSQKVKPYA